MNPDSFESPYGEMFTRLRRIVRERLDLEHVDEETRLSEWDAVLRQKRGCRR